MTILTKTPKKCPYLIEDLAPNFRGKHENK